MKTECLSTVGSAGITLQMPFAGTLRAIVVIAAVGGAGLVIARKGVFVAAADRQTVPTLDGTAVFGDEIAVLDFPDLTTSPNASLEVHSPPLNADFQLGDAFTCRAVSGSAPQEIRCYFERK